METTAAAHCKRHLMRHGRPGAGRGTAYNLQVQHRRSESCYDQTCTFLPAAATHGGDIERTFPLKCADGPWGDGHMGGGDSPAPEPAKVFRRVRETVPQPAPPLAHVRRHYREVTIAANAPLCTPERVCTRLYTCGDMHTAAACIVPHRRARLDILAAPQCRRRRRVPGAHACLVSAKGRASWGKPVAEVGVPSSSEEPHLPCLRRASCRGLAARADVIVNPLGLLGAVAGALAVAPGVAFLAEHPRASKGELAAQ